MHPSQRAVKRLTVDVTEEMHRLLTAIAARDERSLASVVRLACKRYIQEQVAS